MRSRPAVSGTISILARLVLADAVLGGALSPQLVVDEEVVGHLRALHVAVDVASVPVHFEQQVKVVPFVGDVRLQADGTTVRRSLVVLLFFGFLCVGFFKVLLSDF